MSIALASVAISGLIAIYAMIECKEQNYQPSPKLRIILFCTGAIFMFCVTWLAARESFWQLFWFKLLVAISGGYSYAYIAPERLRD